MDKPEVLMLGPMRQMIVDQVDAAFTLHKLWEQPDQESFIASVAPRIRGFVTAGSRVDAALLDRFDNLEVISNMGVGYDNIEASAAGERGIVVTNTPDVLNEEVADTTIGLLLSTIRQFGAAERYLRAGRWKEGNFPLSASLRDRRVGMIGFGRIGKVIARRLDAFGVEVVYHSRNRQPDVPRQHYPSLVEMARDVDVLIAILPGGANTRHLVNAEVLSALGPDGVLINVARGSVVDEAALIEALQKGTILSAGLDVFENEPDVPQALIDMDHVVLLPHLGSASVHTRDAMGQLVVDNLTSWFAGKGPLTPVPETPYPSQS